MSAVSRAEIVLTAEMPHLAYGGHTLIRADGAELATAASFAWFEGQAGDTSRPVAVGGRPRMLTPALAASTRFWVRALGPAGATDSASLSVTVAAPVASLAFLAGSREDGALGDGGLRETAPAALPAGLAGLCSNPDGAWLLYADGTLKAQGAGLRGELGLAAPAWASSVTVALGVRAVALGEGHGLVLGLDGSVKATGYNTSGQLGTGDDSSRSELTTVFSDGEAVAVGKAFSLVLKTDGSLWGAGLVNGANQKSFISLATGVRAIAAGSEHFVWIGTDGTLWGLGLSDRGQLGVLQAGRVAQPRLIASGVSAVAAGGTHTLYLTDKGELWGTGDNREGQLGLGLDGESGGPVRLAAGVAEIAAGTGHTLYRKIDGSLWAVGANDQGQLGDGTTTRRSSPVEIAPGASAPHASGSLSWFRDASGTLRGMGDNHPAVLRPDAPAAAAGEGVFFPEPVISAAGRPRATALLATDGTLLDTGFAGAGAGASGIPTVDTEVLRLVPQTRFYDYAVNRELAGPRHQLYLKTDGSLWGWGSNATGQLTPGGPENIAQPVRLATPVADAAAYSPCTFYLKPDLTLWRRGRLMPYYTSSVAEVPAESLFDTDVAAIQATHARLVYLKGDGTLWGVGDAQHQVLGPATSREVLYVTAPTQIASDVAQFSVGRSHTLILKTNGDLLGYGLNYLGQIGGALNASARLIASGVTKAKAGAWNTYYLTNGGTLWGLGQNMPGGLGSFTSSPVQIRTGVVDFFPSPDSRRLFVRGADGLFLRMGYNYEGELGLTPLGVRPNFNSQAGLSARAVEQGGWHTIFLRDPATVTATAPTISSQPAGQTVAFGGYAELRVGATGTAALAYQWYRGASGDRSTPLAGALGPVLRLPAYAAGGDFWCRVHNLAGASDSAVATVVVSGAGTPAFRAWAETAGLSGSALAPTADADQDGLPNLLEYAFGRGPRSADIAPPTTVETLRLAGENHLVLSHRRAKGRAVALVYERSADLRSWAPLEIEPFVADPDADGDGRVEKVTIALPLTSSDDRLFLRVRVTEP